MKPENTMSIKKVAIINAAGKYSTVILQLIVNIVLARILSANDYGIVAVITTFSSFFYVISALGIGTAIIQIRDLNQDDIDYIFTFSSYFSIFLSIIFIGLSFFIAHFYGNPVYTRLGALLSISLFFNGLNMVPDGIMNLHKKFVSMAVRSAVVYSVSAIVAVVLAYCGWGYYALIVQSIISAVFIFVWNYSTTQPRFRFVFKMDSIKKISSYSGYQMGAQVIGYFSNNFDNLISGKMLGEVSLGYYNKAYTLANYPINNFASILSSVLHPVLADYQDDKKRLYSNHIKINRLFALVGGAAGAAFYLMSKELVFILFGEKWEASVICLQLLSLSIVFRMMNSALNAFFQSLGRTDLLFKNKVYSTLAIIVGVVAGVKTEGSIKGLSIGVTIAYAVFYLIAIYQLMIYGFKFGIKKHILDMKMELLINIAIYAAAFLCPIEVDNLWLSVLFKSIYIGSVFVILAFVLDRKFIKKIIKR